MKNLRLFLSAALLFTVFSSLLPVSAFSATYENTNGKASLESETCEFTMPEKVEYNASVVSIRRKFKLEPSELFSGKVFLKNTGTMPWFSDESECLGPKMFLGTDKERDRMSYLYTSNEDINNTYDTNWVSSQRIGMDQFRVDPGEIASFTFWSKAPKTQDILVEYFTPVLENVTWIDNASFAFEIMVGELSEEPSRLRTKLQFALKSGFLSDINLDGDKEILVDLSDQKMFLKIGDMVVKEFGISTGKSSTPTPVGVTSIILKQEVRVASKYPHYIMPKYMMFRAGGYGIHALPSLGNDGGVFWTEARNHIGIPVSHGCIRLLPEDADFTYDFASVGTKVVVQR
jgi:hypothetical protein